MNKEKNIKDYLHLYLGCEVLTVYGLTKLTAVGDDNYVRIGQAIVIPIDGIRIILRPLSSMTDEELIWWFKNIPDNKYTLDKCIWTTEMNGEPCESHWTLWCKEKEMGCRHGYSIGINNHFSPDEFHWLLSKHFDLFGLIESGLAIDATKIIQHENT